jgi:hypothetical protein
MEEKRSSTKSTITYNPEEKKLFGTDSTDANNLPAFYNKTKRGIKKIWVLICEAYDKNPDLTMSEVITICADNNMRTHYWCMMD